MTLRRAAAAVLACIALGGALALADQGNPPAGAPPPVWTTRPEVPGSASTLVPFGMETTADGSRAWSLGRVGDGTVVLRRGAGGAWAPVGAALGGLAPVGGDAPQHAAEMSADGHGALLVVARGDAHAEAALYTRTPGGDFAAAPAPGAALLAGEHLAGDPTSTAARTLLAASSGDDTTTAGAFVVPTAGDGTAVAVLHFGADGWTREAVHPPGTDALHPLGLAVVSPGQAWLLARAGDTTGGASDRLVLLRRVEGAVVSWEATAILPDALLGGAAPAAGLDAVTVAPAPADPLTAAQDGLWIDLRLKVGDHVVDATEHLRVGAPAGPDPSSSAPSTSTPSSSAPSSSTPSSATPSTTTPAGSAPAPTVQVDGRWCDARTPAGDAICDHPLGLALDGDRGYRSLAFPGTGDRPFGRRFISAPLDAGVAAAAPRRRAERQGGFAALSGERFVLADGIGDDGGATSTTQAIAFDADGNGLVGGARAFGATSLTPPAPIPPVPGPSFRDPVQEAERAPGGDGTVLTLSPFGMQQLYEPGRGWSVPNTLMFTPPVRGRPYAPVRTIAWARPDLLIGAGSAGLLLTLHEAPRAASYAELDNPRAAPGPDLPVSATFLDVACTAGGRLECVAVGLDGLLLRGDGTTWTTERLPGAGAHADITSIRYAGRTALLATSAGLFTGEDGDWHADPTITEPIRVLATLPDGGAAIDGKWERDGPADAWHRVRAPLDWHPIAIAAYRTAGHVRTLVAATADVVPLPAALPDDPRSRPGSPMLMTDPSPDGAVLFRETDDGWVDLDHASYQPSGGRDLPASTPNTRALAVDDAGSGWSFGGPSSQQVEDAMPAVSPSVTAGWIQEGARAAFPDTTATASQATDVPETPVPDGSVRLAIGGHPACLDRCAAAGGQGVAADVHLQGLVARVAALRAGGGGPAALIVGGGRASVGGEPLDLPGARRYRALLQDAGLPTYVLPGPGDLPGGGADAFGAAFATWPAPEGSGPAPAGVDVATPAQPSAADATRARSAFAFDVRAAAGTVRVLAIDNAAGTLTGGTGGVQGRWIGDLLDRSKDQGIAVVVVGSLPLDATAGATPAADAADEIALLAGRASAYVATAGLDDPSNPFFGGALARSEVPSTDGAPLTLLQSATLGYGATQAAADPRRRYTEDDPLRTRQNTAAFLLLDVDVGGRSPETNVARVAPLAEPLATRLGLAYPATTVAAGQAQPLMGIADDLAQQRFLWNGPDGTPQVATGPTSQMIPADLCLGPMGCATSVATDAQFQSSDPSVGLFVAATATTGQMPQVKTDGSGHPVPDDRSPVFCGLRNGTTTVSIRVAGQVARQVVSVVTAPPLTIDRTGPDGTGRVIQPKVVAGTCAFDIYRVLPRPQAETQPAPAIGAPHLPTFPSPSPAPSHPPAAHPAPHLPPVHQTPPAVIAPIPPPAHVAQPMPDASRPPVSPASKPPAPAPPIPPHGLSAQQAQVQAPSPQVQIQQAFQRAERRREHEAFESDHAASAYDPPAPRFPWELVGVAALLVTGGAGGIAGRARRRRVVLAYERRG